MADETQEVPSAPERADRDSMSGRAPTIFVTDAADEASRIADTLRTIGYKVVDVPLSMLVARTQVQRPNVILADVDAPSSLEELGRLRKLPGAGAIDFIYFGSGAGPIANGEDALANEGSSFFVRPIDVAALVRRLDALTGGPASRSERRSSAAPASRGTLPPPSLGPSLASRAALEPSERPSAPSLPSPGVRTPGPPLPMSVPSLAELVDPPRSPAAFGTLSDELKQLLAEAEQRAEIMAQPDSPLPSPEEEIEAVLPADVLASLDEPLDRGDDDEHERLGTGAGHDGTGHGKATTAGGSKQTTASGRSTSATPHTFERRVGSDSPARETTPSPRSTGDWTVAIEGGDRVRASSERKHDVRGELDAWPLEEETTERARSVLRVSVSPPSVQPPASVLPPSAHVSSASVQPLSGRVPPSSAQPPSARISPPRLENTSPSQLPTRGPSEAPARTPIDGVTVLQAVHARRFFAEAITRRLSGALCFESEGVVRRVVVRDGDLVTAASGDERESLVCFLGARGELPRDEVERLAGKVPPYGRHAGAALVAHGWLGQDQLWTALRAHAEWIATRVLRIGSGTVQLEVELPGRLRSEPSVFGASTGAEIFVELVRRAVAPQEAIESLGGEASRIDDGPSPSILAECALSPAELELVGRARGGTLGELLARSVDAEIAAVVHGLALLGVLDVVPAQGQNQVASSSGSVDEAALDEEAVRARIRARLELVDEGDYFAVLGVPHDATGYEVRRAFIELRRAFEPTKILSPRLHDLADDVKKIVVVLEEAYEILRDTGRRERYRRAIEAHPA